MHTTRATLLLRIKDPRDTQAWAEFYELYAPLLYRYARARGLSHDDAEDVRAACYEAIVRQIPHFDYDKSKGGFQAWLRTLVNRRVVDLLRKRHERTADTAHLENVADRNPALDELWDSHWKQQHLRYCVELVRREVSPQVFEAFQLLVQDAATVPEVCQRLAMNPNQVYKAKARVLELVRIKMAAIYSEIGT